MILYPVKPVGGIVEPQRRVPEVLPGSPGSSVQRRFFPMPAFTSVHPTPAASPAWLCQSVVGGPGGSEMWLRVSVWGSFCDKCAAFPVARLQVRISTQSITLLITFISDIIQIYVFVSLIASTFERWCCILENHRTPESPEVLRMACAEALCVAGVSLSLREHCRTFMSRCDPVTSVKQNMMRSDIKKKKKINNNLVGAGWLAPDFACCRTKASRWGWKRPISPPCCSMREEEKVTRASTLCKVTRPCKCY